MSMQELKAKLPADNYIPSENEKEVLDYVLDRIVEMENHRQSLGLNALWDKADKLMETGAAERDPELHIKNPSDVKKSLIREAVFGVLAMTVANNNEVQLIMDDEGDTKSAMVFQKVSEYISYVSKEPVTKIKNYYTTLVLGTGVRKRIYRCDLRNSKEIVSYDPETETVEYKNTVVKDYDNADLQNIDPRNFWWDDRATCNDDMRDGAERRIVPYSSFHDEYPESRYKNSKYVRPGSWYFGETDERRNTPIFSETGEGLVEVWEYINKLKDMRVIIANGVLLTKPENPNPYRHKQLPWTISIFQLRDANRIDGIGLPELLEQDQKLLDTLLNFILDWTKFLLNKPVLESSSDDMEGEGDVLELEAGKRIKVTDVNNFKWWDIPQIDQSVFTAYKEEETNARRKVGMDDPMGGVKTGGTATENAIAAQATKEKIGLFFKMLEEEVDVRDEWLKLNIIQQFYTVPTKLNPIIGVDGEPIRDEAGEPMMNAEYRKLPIGVTEGTNEFGETEYKEKKGAYMEMKPMTLGVKEDKYATFTVRVVSRSTLPISKELRQQKWNETLKTINEIPYFAEMADWQKLWKKTGEINEFDAEDFTAQPMEDSLNQLAEEENNRMMQGEAIPPTQGATEAHTAIHMALADSIDFESLPPEAQKAIVQHAQGEVAEQRMMGGEQTLDAARSMHEATQAQDMEQQRQLELKTAAPPPPPQANKPISTNQNVNIGA